MHHLSDFEEPHIDLTPLIDAVFLLLIFFIMATTFSRPVLEVALAQADSAASRELLPERLTVTIDQAGEIYFEDEVVESSSVPEHLSIYPIETHIIFNIDQDAPFGTFVRVLDVAKAQQRKNFVINSSHAEASRPGASRGDGGKNEPALP